MLILHTLGAKSGQVRQNPLVYRQEGETYYIFASKGGVGPDQGAFPEASDSIQRIST